ncbi:MAG: glycoside hydrolase family 97 protein [Chitinophagaceae bacterium]|jgi:alpha-glucosidase|nr:glycoside hydrolase family 97 protein [Chitinophagaceae bacterium]
MKNKTGIRFFLVAITIVVAGRCTASVPIVITSPDGKIVCNFFIKKGIPAYKIEYDKSVLVDTSLINFELANGIRFTDAYFINNPANSLVNDRYHLIVGKTSEIKQQYKSVSISVKDSQNKNLHIIIECRLYNDGAAFRYFFQKSDTAAGKFILQQENTQFKIKGNPIIKALLRENYTTSHEGLYTTDFLNKITPDTLMDLPLLVIYPQHVYMAITEAALLDYAGMYLTKHNNVLLSRLSPLPENPAIKIIAQYPHYSPWRVFLIGKKIGDLLESNIITSLNAPCKIKDTQWIQPGTCTFPWWNGTIVPATVKGGNNFETNKYYIDFCAAHNIRYHTVVEYGGHEWYTNDGEGYQPGNHADITKPVDGLDMKKICDYAHSKNVGVRVWTHWRALYPKLDTAFALFEQWGLSGLMVDFMDRDDQEMVNIQTEILEKAAQHHLHIQFHGAYKPTGLSRTYPNEFTREGTLNYEHDKWDSLVTPEADLNVAVTRLLAGATDYHLGGFRALPVNKFIIQEIRPYVMGTRCHMLAMYIVLENYLPMVCDYPDAYIHQPGFEVIEHIPATWDETRVPAESIDQNITIARRKNNTWYVGTINNSIEKDVVIPMNFLPLGKSYQGTMYSDTGNSNNTNLLSKTKIEVSKNTNLKVHLASGGGNVIIVNLKQ